MAPAAVALLSLLAMPVRVQERCRNDNDTSISVSLLAPTTRGNLVVVGVTVPPSPPVTITAPTDESGNVYTPAAAASSMVAVFTSLVARPAQVVTVSVSPAAGTNVFVVEYAGVNEVSATLLASGGDGMARVGPLERTSDDDVLLGVVAILSGRPRLDAGTNDAGFELILDCTGDVVAEQLRSARGPQSNVYLTTAPNWESTTVRLSASPDSGAFTDGGVDGGSDEPDGGTIPVDDAGVTSPSRLLVGCGCRTSDAPFLSLAVLAVVTLLRRAAPRASRSAG